MGIQGFVRGRIPGLRIMCCVKGSLRAVASVSGYSRRTSVWGLSSFALVTLMMPIVVTF